jgi:hypothetical protein
MTLLGWRRTADGRIGGGLRFSELTNAPRQGALSPTATRSSRHVRGLVTWTSVICARTARSSGAGRPSAVSERRVDRIRHVIEDVTGANRLRKD